MNGRYRAITLRANSNFPNQAAVAVDAGAVDAEQDRKAYAMRQNTT
jgi:hypothetical protein